MKASLQAPATEAYQQKKRVRGGLHDLGHCNRYREEIGFFCKDRSWSTEYGQFFLERCSGKLREHDDNILGAAFKII
ncbi:hypothetical protein RND81_05G179000 [Saponaria officinalis]|uniref:Beta-amylase n=1 Tax=Saponaria officinalis TaxID=3572 RepID=A0AAW1KTS1_SAPOF